MKLANGFLLTIAMLALLVSVSFADGGRWIAFDGGSESPPLVSVVASDMNHVVLEIEISGVNAEEMTTDGGIYAYLRLPGYGSTAVVSEAALPAIRELVEVPCGAEATVRVLDAETRTATLTSLGIDHRLFPLQAPIEKIPGAVADADFAFSEEYYAGSSFMPAALARIGEGGTVRGHNFVLLEMNPVRYSPVLGEIEYCTRITLEVEFTGGDLSETRRLIERYNNRYSEKLASDMFVNHADFAGRYTIPLPIGYLIVTHDSFYDAIQPLADWKLQKGFDVTVVRTSDIPGGNTKENIKAYIQDAYDNWDVPPTFVLLVGDTGYVSHWVGTESSNPSTDLYYVTMDGEFDWQPDIWIGRFSCTTAFQVTNLVDKTVDYEKFNLSSGTAWIKKAVFMASNDNYEVSEGTHDYVIRQYLDRLGYYSQRLYCHTYHATTQQVRDAFNDGRSLGIFSGHGSVTYWDDGPRFTATDVNNLTNEEMLPLVHSYSCLTGLYSSSCFGETWINASGKGALVFWGSSATSYWDQDDVLEKGAFEACFGEGYTWACGISHRALYHLYQHYSGGGSTHRYFEMYNILGDPSVDIWTDVPATFDVSHAAEVPVGATSFDVTVNVSGGDPVEYALVHVEKADDGVTEASYTDAAGFISIPLTPPIASPGTLDVTVTKHDFYHSETTATSTSTGVPDDPEAGISGRFILAQNEPNPFNPVTAIRYALPEHTHVSVRVYDVSGALVRTLADRLEDSGWHSVIWDGRDDLGRTVASGVYFFGMEAGEFSEKRSMVLLK
jgi:hypothetical protein